MASFFTRLARRTVALATFLAFVVAAPRAQALVDGTPPQLKKKITVQGGSVIIGNTVLGETINAGSVNNVPLATQNTVADVTNVPSDATLVQAYVFWSGSLRPGQSADQLADVQLPDGTVAPNVPVEQCFFLPRTGGGVSSAYYCRADITTVLGQHLARQADGTRTLNGTYNVMNFDAEPGHPDAGPGRCSDPADPCQAAFGGWSLILVYSSPAATTTKDIVIYDGFLRMDEVCGFDGMGCRTPSSGVSAPITLGGFNAVNRNVDVSFFALEGDRLLGAPPERDENADFMRFDGVELGTNSSSSSILPKNLFNSTIFNRGQGATPFSGVDIKTVAATLPRPSGFPPSTTSVTIQPGSGDGNPDPGPDPFNIGESNGELFYLGNVMLAVDALAPSFRNSTKKVDKATAAPGDQLIYSIHVENNGTFPANATLKDVIPADVTYVPGSTTLDGSPVADAGGNSALAGAGVPLGQLWPIGVPGFKQFADVTFKATIKPAFAGGTICNTASVEASYNVPGSGTTTLPPLPVKSNPCTTVTRPNLRQPLLTATVPGTWPDVRPGDVISYHLTLANTGAQAASGITLTADLPKFVKFDPSSVSTPFGADKSGSTPTGGANGTGQVKITGISVPGNFGIDVTFTAQVLDDVAFAAAGGTDGAALAVRGFLSGASVDPALSGTDDPLTTLPSDPTTVFVRFGVDLASSQKTVTGDSGGIVTPGTALTWTVRLANNGAKAATAQVNDDLPAFLTNCRVISGPIACSAGGANGSGRVAARAITVPAGGFVDVSFAADVVSTAPDGATLTNVALLTAAERAGVTWQARAPTVTVRSQVVFASTKTVLDVNGGGIEPGDELLYTITLKNTGNRTSSAVTIKDSVDPALTFVSASDGGTLSAGTVLWTPTTTPALASLSAGQQVTVTMRARINATVANGTVISNQALSGSADASAKSDDPATTAANDPTIVKVIAAPSFVDSTKTVVDQNGGSVKPGDLLDWKIDVKNTGRAIGTSIVVTDVIDPNLDIVSIGSGGTAAGQTVTWNIAQLTPGQAHPTLVVTTRVKTPLANGTVIGNQATMRSAEAPTPVPTDDPTTATVDDATTVKVTSSVSLAQSTKTVTDDNGGETLPGDTLTWRIRVVPQGDSPAADVTVLDTIDRCLTGVVAGSNGLFDGTRIRWDKTTTPALASVVPGTPVELTFTAKVAAGLADGTLCSNQANLSTPTAPIPSVGTDDPNTPALNDPTTINITSRPVLTASTKIAQLVDDANSDGFASPGDKIRYTITVLNSGSDTAKGVTLTDTISPLLQGISLSTGGTLAGGVASWTLGDIAPLTNKIVTIDAAIQKPLDDGTILDNQGTIRATNVAAPALTDDPATPAPNDVTRLVLRSAPKLAATKTALDVNGGRVQPGDLVRYTISLVNTGTSLARGVRVADTLDANLTFVSASAGGTFDATTRTVTFSPGTLDLTTTQTFTIDAKIAAALDNGTPIDNQAKTTSNEVTTAALSDDPATTVANDPTRIVVISAADLTTSTKTFVDRNGGDLRPGDIVDYTIVVKNTGNAFARGLRIEDPLDSRLTAQLPIDGGGTVQGSSVVWTPAAPLAPGESATFKLAARIALPLADGTEIANQAQLLATGLVTPFVTDDPSTPAASDPTKLKVKAAPSLSSTKTVLDVNGGDVRPGDQLDWKITLKNTGDANGTNGTLTDVLDPNLEFVSATSGGTFDAASRTVKWTGITVTVPDDVVFTVSTRAKRPLPNATVIGNQASLSVAELGGATLSDDPATPAPKDPTRVTVVAKPDLSKSEKRAVDLNGGDLSPEDVVEYAITLKNTGDNAATAVVVTDVVDALLTNVTPLDGGTFDATTRKLTWNVPSVDVSPAGDKVLHFRATVAPLLATGTKIANQAFVISDRTPLAPTDDPSTPAPQDPTSVTVISAPQLQTSTKIVVDDDGGLVRPGDQLTYTIVVKNTGNTYATDVSVEDPIDPQLTDIRPDQGGVFVNGRIRWDKTNVPALAKLAPKTQTVTLTFRAKIAADTKNGVTLLNQANLASAEGIRAVTDDPGTTALGDPTGITTQFPDLSRTVKTVLDENGGNVEPGDFLTYTIRIPNDGIIPANDVVVEDVLDANLVDVAATNATIVGNKATWSKAGVPGLAKLDANQSIELTVRGRVKALTKNATVIANQASVKARELVFPVLSDADLATAEKDPTKVTVVAHPKLETSTLSVEDPNGDEVRPNDRLVYRLTVKNTGNTVGSHAVVTVTVPPELVDVKLDTPGTMSGKTITWDRATVPGLASVVPGTDPVLQFNAAVKSPLKNGTIVSVQGSIKVDELESPVLTDDPATPILGDPTSVRVFSAPRFVHSEKAITDLNGGTLEAGDEAMYEIVVLNDGTEPATGTRVFDVVPPGTTYVAGSFLVNGTPIADGGTFPLTNGLLVKSKAADAAEGQVLVQDGQTRDAAAVLQFRVKLSRTVLPGTSISNQASIASDTTKPQVTDDPTTPMLSDPTVSVVGGGVSLTGARLRWKLVEDRGQPQVVNPGDVVEMTVEVPNSGTIPVSCLVSALPLDTLFDPEGDLGLDAKKLTAALDTDDGEWVSETGLIPTANVRLGELKERGLKTITLRARARANVHGVATAQAKISCPNSIAQLTDSDPTVPGDQPARIPVVDGAATGFSVKSSTKTVEDLNGGEVMPGDVLRYRITVVNDGPSTAKDLVVTDTLPPGVTFVLNSVQAETGFAFSGDVTEGVSTASGKIAELAAGARLTATFLATVDPKTPIGKPVANKANLSGPGIDPIQELGPATVVVGGLAGASALTGRVFEDLDDDGKYGGSDAIYPGFQVQLYGRQPAKAEPTLLKSVFTDAKGDYVLPSLPGGEYELQFRAPDGTLWQRAAVAGLAGGETRIVDALLVPTGVIYRVADKAPVAGARAYVTYDDAMVGKAPPICDEDQTVIRTALDPAIGKEVPRRVGEKCLLPGQQGQHALDSGAYRFDLPDVIDAVDYRLWVVPGSAALAFPSASHPAESTFAPKGKVAAGHRPKAGPAIEPYYTKLRSTGRPDEITQNHIPVDEMEDALRITKQASRASVHIGEFVTYTVAVTNGSAQDLLSAGGTGGVSVVDAFPEHLRYVRGSARALRRTAAGDACAIVSGTSTDCDPGKAEPQGALEGTGGLARFGPYDLKAGESLLVRYTLAVTGAAKPGDYDNVAHAEYEAVRVTRDARATVRVMWDALFDESSVIGKVFCDDDANGLQTPGEIGVGLARIWSDNGYFVEADSEGKFHFAGLRPGLHLFKLDERTLPPGSTAGEGVRRSYYLTAGLDARINFPVKCDWPESKPDVVRVMKDKPPPPPPPVVPPPPPPPVIVNATIDPPDLALDGVAAKPPMADVRLELKDEARRESQNAGFANGKVAEELTFRVLPLPGPVPQKWSFTISEANGPVVHEESGTGALPPLLTWNGDKAKAGTRYNYGVTLSSNAGYTFTSAPKSFGVDWFDPKVGRAAVPPPPEPLAATLTGELFGALDAKPRAALINALSLFVGKLPKSDDKVRIAVYADPADKNAPKLTADRAKVVQSLLEAQGVATARIETAGYGGNDPLVVVETPKGKKPDAKALKAAQEANRRVVLAATLPVPPPPAPPGVPQPAVNAGLWIEGQPAQPGADGKIRLEVPRPEKGGFTAHLVTPTGAAIDAKWLPVPRVTPTAGQNVLVQVDTRRALVSVGSADVVVPMLASDVLLSGGSIVELGDKGPKHAMRFGVTGVGSAAQWLFYVKDAEGRVVKQLDGKGAPPAELSWDGLGPSKAPAIRAGSYTYQLMVTDERGNRLQTAKKPILAWIPPTPFEEMVMAADLFQKPTDAKVKPGAKKLLQALAKRLLATTGNIVIEGHSDSDETLQLTSDRAIAVRAQLVELGVPADRLTALGRGAANPRAPNVSPKSREKNRRIEIRTAQKLPILPDANETVTVKIAGLTAQDATNGVWTATLGEAPTTPFDIEYSSTNGRLVRCRLETPPGELHEDKAGTTRRAVFRAVYAQAGDDLPPLPEGDFLPPPDDATPATAPATTGTAPAATGTSGTTATPVQATTTPVQAAPTPVQASPAVVQDAHTPVQMVPGPVQAAEKPVQIAEKPVQAAPSLPPDEVVGEKILVSMHADDAKEIPAGKLLVRMPRDHAQLRTSKVLIKGLTDAKNEVTVNGEKVAVDELGRFWKALELAPGDAKVTVQTKDAAGNLGIVERHYEVDPKGLFVMGIADAAGGSLGGELAGQDNLELKLGGVRRAFLGGRLAGVAAGELNGANYLGGFFKTLKLTANVDSNRRNDDSAFRDLVDPSRYYPIWGDGSTLVQAAPARGPVYARLDADDSHAMFGDFRTAFGKSDLFRYDRTLYGADVLVQKPVNDKYTPSLQLTGAPGDARVRHGHVEMLATGGSIYYLQGGNVIEGTEHVRVVVRDRDTGLELSRSDRQRYTDYLVSYVDGRLLFKQPVSAIAEATFLANTNVATAQQGHPVFVVVDYEYRDVAGNQGGTLGGYTRHTLAGGLLTLGGGIVQESRGAASPYRLVGAEIGTKKSERTYANLEFGRSWGTDANSFFSADGGLSWSQLGSQCVNPNDPACTSVGNGWKFDAAGELGELLGRKDDLLGLRLYFQNLGRGYFANGALVEQGTMKYGGQIRYPIGPKDALLARHDSVESVLDRDPATAGIQAKTVIRRVSGLQYRHTEEKWGAVAEYANVLTTDTGVEKGPQTVPMDTILAGGNYRPFKDLNLTLTQEGIVRGDPKLLPTWRDHLTTTLGAQYKLTDALTATAAESVRWNGDNATQLGLATQVSDSAQLYLNERLATQAGQLVNTTLVGGSAEAWKGARAYGEYQLDNAVGGQQNRAVLGLNNRWTLKPGMLLSAGYERSQVLGNGSNALSQGGVTGAAPGATAGNVLGVPAFGAPGMNPATAITPGAASRDVASFGLEYLASSRFKLSGRLEGRFDNADEKFAKTTPGIADRLQLLALGNADFKWTDDLAVLGRVVYADAFIQDAKNALPWLGKDSTLDARYLEATAGLALRPVQYDWFAVLMKVSRVIDRRPIDLVAKTWDMQTSDVVAIAPTFETPWKLGIAEKLAFKHVKSDVTGVPTQTSYVVLNVNRLDYHVLPEIDLSLEYRFLWTRIAQNDSNKDAPAQGDHKHGAVFEVAYRPLPFMRVGAGYSFASFSDNELTRLDQNAGGFFVRATGQY